MHEIRIDQIKPAAYNPRFLSEDAFWDLVGSIRDLGFILPIIVNSDNKTIVAGHQRTKVATHLGFDKVPCYFINGCDLQDEIIFNQIHNGVEYEPEQRGTCDLSLLGYHDAIDNKHFHCPDRNAVLVSEISRLLIKFKDPLCAIICEGEILFGNNYVYAAKSLNMPINCSFIPKEKLEKFNFYFTKKYGVFNYQGLDRKDFVQGLAQPPRYSGIDWSVLYRASVQYVFELPKDTHILDFGCGKGLCINKLRTKEGYKNAIGLEFFNHNTKGIAVGYSHKMIDKVFNHIRKHGAFDIVFCDAVVNSVNTQEAEEAVITCLNLFCKMGGMVFMSGRTRENEDNQIRRKRSKVSEGIVRFFDKDGLTGILREGQWFYQKFLYKHQVEAIPEKYGFEKFMSYYSNYFGLGMKKTRNLPLEEYHKAVDYEFNLSLPNQKSFNRHEEMKELIADLTGSDK